MPSPYAHLIAACLFAAPQIRQHSLQPRNIENAAIFLCFSLAPDLDAIPGVIAGNIAAYHNQFAHSPLFLTLVALISALLIKKRWLSHRTYRSILITALAALALHLTMDSLTHGRGLLLLWPFSEHRFAAPFPLFYGVRYSNGLFSPSLWITLLNETLIMGLVTIIIVAFHRRKQNNKHIRP